MENLVEKNVRVTYNRRLNCLLVNFSGIILYEDFVRVLQYEFQMVQFYRLRKCLVDLSEIKLYPSGSKEYIQNVWFPYMESNGMKYIAFIVPKNGYGKASMHQVHEKVTEYKNVKIRYFKDEASAFAWIQQVFC